MRLYHASTSIIEKPDVLHSRDKLDFGKGFYLTTIREQAVRYAERKPIMVFQYIFQEDSYKEIILFYDALLQTYLPENAQVFAFGGVSWGGGLAYSMASMWHDRTGQLPMVVMADTLLNADAAFNMALISGTLDSFCAKRHIPREVFNESFVKRATIVAMIEQRGKVMPHYEGPVILMNALQVRGGKSDANVALWKQLASNLTVVDYDTTHDVLCVDAAWALAFCQHLFDALIRV